MDLMHIKEPKYMHYMCTLIKCTLNVDIVDIIILYNTKILIIKLTF